MRCLVLSRNGGGSTLDIKGFNEFITDMDLLDVPVFGKKFSWFCLDDISMSRLDRLCIPEGLVSFWNVLGQWIGDQDISNCCPIWLVRSVKDWGPKPFKFINGWLEHDEFIPFVRSCPGGFEVSGNKAYVVKEKFKKLK